MTIALKEKPENLGIFINLDTLRVGTAIPFDLFIKEEKKYNHVLKEKQVFSSTTRNDLLKSGIDKLFLPITYKENYRSYLNHYLKEIVADKNITIKEKCISVYQYSSSVLEDLFTNPESKLTLSQARNAVSCTIDMIYTDERALKTFMEIGSINYTVFTHSVDVAIYAISLATHLKYPRNELFKIGYSAMLHDIGKAKVSHEILQKTCELTEDEFSEVKKHSMYGYQILQYHNETNSDVLDGILYHHEKYDGSGYPEKLKGEFIPKISQIIAIADVFSAVSTNKSYKNAVSSFETLSIMKKDMSKELNGKFLIEFIKLISKSSLLK